MESNNWQKRTLVFSFIAIESLLVVIGTTKPAFSSYFAFSRHYRSGFKKIRLSERFKAGDRNRKRGISATKIESFRSNIPYNGKYTTEPISVLDSIVSQEKLEFARFKSNLTTNQLEFSVSTRENKLKPLINSASSHRQVNFKKELDNFLSDRHKIASIDSKETGKNQVSSTALWEVDSLIIILILGVILFRINQQIHNKPQLNRESQELNLSNNQSSEDRLFK